MMVETTGRQIAALALGGRPLVICDVDEVVVHFTRDLEDYLDGHGLQLDTTSFALNGNIRRKSDNSAVEAGMVHSLVENFFMDRCLQMQPIDGAVEALLKIAELADLVMLTNLPHEAGELRRQNLAGHGLPFPVVTNSGPKGPAVKALATLCNGTCVFIDDSPGFIASAFEHAPDVHLVHFLHDERFAVHVAHFDFVSLRAGTWEEARPHVLNLIR